MKSWNMSRSLALLLAVNLLTPIFVRAEEKGSANQISNSVGMKMVLISKGEFQMGSPISELGQSGKHEENESPQHRVRITKSFYLGQTEVTQGQWQTVMGTTPWNDEGNVKVKEGKNYPATYVSWADATEFCRKLSMRESKTYRLPTEAEWEYACRAGTSTKFSFGDDESRLSNYAWFGLVADGTAKNEPYGEMVGVKRSNSWGFYDMHGNVWEWCYDWYDEKFYGQSGIGDDPNGPRSGSERVIRGGSQLDTHGNCRSAIRGRNAPDVKGSHLGFRVVLVP